jgi:hypothetical protein
MSLTTLDLSLLLPVHAPLLRDAMLMLILFFAATTLLLVATLARLSLPHFKEWR